MNDWQNPEKEALHILINYCYCCCGYYYYYYTTLGICPVKKIILKARAWRLTNVDNWLGQNSRMVEPDRSLWPLFVCKYALHHEVYCSNHPGFREPAFIHSGFRKITIEIDECRVVVKKSLPSVEIEIECAVWYSTPTPFHHLSIYKVAANFVLCCPS